jgi:hypothetical protein
MSTKKAPTRGGRGKKSGVDSFFSAIKAAVVKVFVVLAVVGRAGGCK